MSQGLSQGLAWVDSTQLPNLQEAELERLLGTVKNRRTVKNRKFRTEPEPRVEQEPEPEQP